MRRLYLTELLGFSEGTVKVLGIVFLTVLVAAVLYALWSPLTKQKKRKALLHVLPARVYVCWLGLAYCILPGCVLSLKRMT